MAPQCISAKLRIVTPMFLGGARQEADPSSVRVPSIKGALRFYWRAMQWGRMAAQFPDESPDKPDAALRELHRREAILFGQASKEGAGGQGLVLPVVKMLEPLHEGITDWSSAYANNSDAAYLGYGLWGEDNGDGRSHRQALQKDVRFEIRFLVRPFHPKNQPLYDRDEMLQGLKGAVRLWGLMGGLGGRARRGFGSVALEELDGRHESRDENT